MHGETRPPHFAAAATVRQLVSDPRQIHTRSVLHLSSRAAPRPRFFGREHRDNILGSTATFLVIFAVCLVALGIGAYYYAQWSLGVL